MKYLLRFFIVLFVALPMWASCSDEVEEIGDRPDVPEDRPHIVIEERSDSLPKDSLAIGRVPKTIATKGSFMHQ